MNFSVPWFRLSALLLILGLAGCQQNQDQGTPPAQPPPPLPPQPQAESSAPATPAKPKITKFDDLPHHTYPVQGTVLDLVTSDAKFAALAAQVRKDVDQDLADYDIEDKTTLKGLKGTLLMLDLLEGKNDDARSLIAELRNLEDKPALKLTSGFIAETRLDVEDQTKTTDLSSPAFQQAFQKELAARAAAMPWNVVQDELKGIKSGFEIVSRNLVLGEIQSEIEPAVKKTGSLDDDLAGAIIHIRSSLEFSIPLKAPIVAALDSVVHAQTAAQAAKPDIWPDRAVTLTSDEKATPVVVGIWDSGVDPKVYPDLLFTDSDWKATTPPELTDPHGLAFDLHSNRVHGELYPLGDKASLYPEMISQLKGFSDLEASIESPEATALKAKISKLTPDQVKSFREDLELFGNYIHGSHVAGIATQGDPFARILIARITFDYHIIPEKPTVEQARKDAAADQAYVDYFKQHGVRVVNMSWGGSLSDVEEALEENGVGDPVERKKEANEIFDIGRDGLYNAMKGAPDILFVTAAGNSDNDVNFDEVIPSSFDLPNMITVGAVDQAGAETSFTSFGKHVIAYADGFEVESPVPGGSKLKLSGTSMASPEVTNLAAKLFALDPALKPADVIDLIKSGLTPNPDDSRIFLLDPKQSVDLLQKRLASAADATPPGK
jgi:subtilisin family serine protease